MGSFNFLYRDDVVRYGGNVSCTCEHTSSALFETDLSATLQMAKNGWRCGLQSDHADATYYKVDDIVKYGQHYGYVQRHYQLQQY